MTNSRGMGGNTSVSSRTSHHHHHQQQQQHHNAPSNHASQPHSHNDNAHNDDEGTVFNVEWTDLNGKLGYYTGEIDEEGEPHGLGSMRYVENNAVLEGEWYHGEFER